MSAARIMHLLTELVRGIGNLLLLPIMYTPGLFGNKLRYVYYRRKLGSLGRGAVIDVGVQISGGKHIHIGDDTHVDKFCILSAGAPPTDSKARFIEKENANYTGGRGELRIGSRVHIAPFVLINAAGGVHIGKESGLATGSKILSSSHHYRDPSIPDQSAFFKFSTRVPDEEKCLFIGPVVMQDNTALGIQSIIMPGVTLGENSWLGLMSYAMHDIPPNVIAGGMPAKPVKARFPDQAST